MKKKIFKGFTLIEVILSITLMSFIIVAISGGIHFGHKIWQTDKSSDTFDDLEESLNSLKNLLERTYLIVTYQQLAPNSPPQILFDGDPVNCKFIALSEGNAQWGGLVVINIKSSESSNGVDLIAQTSVYRPNEGLSTIGSNTKTSIIIRNIDFIHFTYYGVSENNGIASWKESWKNYSNLPSLIKLSIGINRHGHILEASSVVHIKQG